MSAHRVSTKRQKNGNIGWKRDKIRLFGENYENELGRFAGIRGKPGMGLTLNSSYLI